jgi:autotransporter-associated beta strand protein
MRIGLEIAPSFCCDPGMKRFFLALCFFSCLIADQSFAGSATWSANPITGDWNTAANWTPNTVPNGPSDIATFGLSNQTGVAVSGFDAEVSELIFSPGASPFSINVNDGYVLTNSGIGIVNNSGITQNFVVTTESNIYLSNNATAGDVTLFTLKGGHGYENFPGRVGFFDTASAGNGTFVLESAETANAYSGGSVFFVDNSSAGNGSFTVMAATHSGWSGGSITLYGNSTAGNGTFVVEGATVPGAGSATIYFDVLGTASAGNAVFIVNGGSASGAAGGFVNFPSGTAANATFIANPGTNGGGGGAISFYGGDGGDARIEVFGNGYLIAPFSVGSVEGDGLVKLGNHQLITGSNDLSTTFSGTIQDAGILIKIGNGTLTLSSANTYTGGTSISAGTLLVKNITGSATGTGTVQTSGGTLGGKGIIAGPTTVGTGSGDGAFLQPGKGSSTATTLTIQNTLTFQSDGTYTWKLNTKKGKADQVIAKGVTIQSGAQFDLTTVGNKKLTTGKVFTAISNTAATGISGAFANLADGSTVTLGVNKLQVSYSGGDGNDLTLTVVP